jgi:AcrR family transcriptional regulator
MKTMALRCEQSLAFTTRFSMTPPTLEKRLRPRKTPRQPRSAETQARILAAARHIFAVQGYAAGTTNRIAEAAGMSVGSLYQYFPNKDAILVALVRAHVEDGTTAVLAAMGDRRADDPAATVGIEEIAVLVRGVVTAMVSVHARDRHLHQVLFEESPRPPSLLAELAELENGVVQLVADLLAGAFPDLADPVLPARIAVVTIESLVHRLVANDRPLDLDRFIDETTRLVTGYVAALAP